MLVNDNLYFLDGGGEMGELCRKKDWTPTILGPPRNWPQSLRTTLGNLLSSPFPMFLFWGRHLTCFYNDAYRPSLGNNGKHPSILGNGRKGGMAGDMGRNRPDGRPGHDRGGACMEQGHVVAHFPERPYGGCLLDLRL